LQPLVLHTFLVAGRSGRQPKTYVKPEAAITVFELLMMGGVSPQTWLSHRSGRQPKTYVKPEAAITAPDDGRFVARNMLSN